MSVDTDVVVVGAGIAGALVAAGLAARGVRVTVLEAGPDQIRNDAVTRFRETANRDTYPAAEYAPQGEYVQLGPTDFGSGYLRRRGGSTWHWLGLVPRLLPSDFMMQTTFGVGVDWPISYEQLEPWYVKAEEELGVAGPRDASLLLAPRSRPYPMPPIPASYLDSVVSRAASRIGLSVGLNPHARNSVNRRGRPPCCGSSSCVPICPIGAKYDATVHLAEAERLGARVIVSSPVVAVRPRPGRVVVTMRPSGGATQTLSARTVVLAANAIETPKILLMSKSEESPRGLGNEHDQVGRYLMDHPQHSSSALASEPLYPNRGPGSTSAIDAMRDGPRRSHRSGFRIEINNNAVDSLQEARRRAWEGPVGPSAFGTFQQSVGRTVRLTALCESLPDARNRVSLADKVDAAGIPLPQVSYRPGDYAEMGRKEAVRVIDRIFRSMNCSGIRHGPQFGGSNHIMGTTRMGADPRTSVVDADLRVHGHPNCFVVGSGVFPTAGTANPTLTIAALALRSVATIHRSLGE